MAKKKPAAPEKKAVAAKTPVPAGPERLYTLDVVLLNGLLTEEFVKRNRKVSRTILIRGGQTLEDLHLAIFAAFDRYDEHLYEFQFGKKPMDRNGPRYSMDSDEVFGEVPTGLVQETKLDMLGLTPKQQFFYWFDFGDDWWHTITVAAIESPVPPGQYPRVTNRVGESPPQYPDLDEEE